MYERIPHTKCMSPRVVPGYTLCSYAVRTAPILHITYGGTVALALVYKMSLRCVIQLIELN